MRLAQRNMAKVLMSSIMKMSNIARKTWRVMKDKF